MDSSALIEGMSFVEKRSGTNAIGLSLILKEPVITLPHHHFCNYLKKWSYYAIPLQVGEKIIGCIAVATISPPLTGELMVILHLLAYKLLNEHKKMLQKKEPAPGRKNHLTAKQLAVLKLMAKGLTDKSMAQELGLNIGTIKYHKQNIFRIMEVNCTVEAVVKALKFSLLSLEEIEM